jgi:hypothetical protein
LTLNEAEEAYQPQFSFRFEAPAHRFVLIEIDNQLVSVGGYKMPKKVYRVVEVAGVPEIAAVHVPQARCCRSTATNRLAWRRATWRACGWTSSG